MFRTALLLLFPLAYCYKDSNSCVESESCNSGHGQWAERSKCAVCFLNAQREKVSCMSGSTTLLCCKTLRKMVTGEASKKICAEMAKSVFVLEDSYVLFPGAESQLVDTCGMTSQTLIVGGVEALEAEIPHQAHIGYNLVSKPNGSPVYMCGGTLISQTHTLCAAHCYKPSAAYTAASWVRVGVLDYTKDTGILLMVKKAVVHEKYNPALGRYNDIMVLFHQHCPLTPSTRPACLNTDPDFCKGWTMASGFGRTQQDGPVSTKLLKTQLKVTDYEECAQSYGKPTGLADGINKLSQICAGGGSNDTCQGDSGGPLVKLSDDHYCMYSLCGITSFGKKCASNNSAGVYTNVNFYIDWIETTCGWQSGY